MSDDPENTQERRNITLRLTPMQWHRVRALALDLEVTSQDMLVAGLNRIFAEYDREALNPKLRPLPSKEQIMKYMEPIPKAGGRTASTRQKK